jgi:hypothetical protein
LPPLIKFLVSYLGITTLRISRELVERLGWQEKVIQVGILEIQYQLTILFELQSLLIEEDGRLAHHFEEKQRVFKRVNRWMEESLIMLKQDTLEQFLHKIEQSLS